MKHTMYTFRLHRNGVVLTVVGGLFVAILLFAAGYLSGLRNRTAPRLAKVSVPSVAVPSPPKPVLPKPNVPEAPAAEALTLQVGMFASEEEAKDLITRLTAQQLPAGMTQALADAGPLFIVQVGRFASRREAADAAGELSQRGIAASVVRAPSIDATAGPL